jgi:O-antigen ligase
VKELFLIVVFLSLVGNLYPAFNVLALVGLFPAYYMWKQNRVFSDPDATPKQTLRFLTWAYVYWITSYLLTGASISNFFSFEFMRRDGAILIAYSPLFLFGDFGLSSRFVRRCVVIFLSLMAAVAAVGALEFEDKVGVSLGLSDLPDSLQFVHYAALSEYGFHGLFQAHNSAGAVYGQAACLALSMLVFLPSLRTFSWPTFWFGACFSGLALSKSRTAYIAFLGAAVLLFFSFRKHPGRLLKIAVFVVVPSTSFGFTQPVVTTRADSISAMDDPNVMGRLELYAQAVKDITLSPLVGIGFGRFNDEWNDYSGIPNFIYIATRGDVVNDSTHAHNSYLHFWAEGGMIGLILMMGIWISLFRWVRRAQLRFSEGSFEYAFARGIQACIVLEFLVSFTEHSMGTAVTSLVIFSMVGLLRNLVAERCSVALRQPFPAIRPIPYLPGVAGPDPSHA